MALWGLGVAGEQAAGRRALRGTAHALTLGAPAAPRCCQTNPGATQARSRQARHLCGRDNHVDGHVVRQHAGGRDGAPRQQLLISHGGHHLRGFGNERSTITCQPDGGMPRLGHGPARPRGVQADRAGSRDEGRPAGTPHAQAAEHAKLKGSPACFRPPPPSSAGCRTRAPQSPPLSPACEYLVGVGRRAGMVGGRRPARRGALLLLQREPGSACSAFCML